MIKYLQRRELTKWTMRRLRLGPRLKLIPPSSGLLRGVRWFKTDVLGLPISPIYKDQTVQEQKT
jgi:hypothetical protein